MAFNIVQYWDLLNKKYSDFYISSVLHNYVALANYLNNIQWSIYLISSNEALTKTFYNGIIGTMVAIL